MKSFFFGVFLLLVFQSCNHVAKDEFEVKGEIVNFEDGMPIYLERFNEENFSFETFDTAIVKGAKFYFKGKINTEPTLCYIRPETTNGKAMFILENGSIKIKIDKDSMQFNQLSGTKNNDYLQKYNDLLNPLYRKMAEFQSKNSEKLNNAFKNNDTITLKSMQDEYENLSKKQAKLNLEFVESNKDAFINPLILENLLNQNTATAQEVLDAYSSISKEVKSTKKGLKVKEMLDTLLNVTIGKPAPDFSGPTPDGTTISFKNSLGKLTLIDFWAAWCAPCRRENPNVVKLYNEFKDKGFQIIGVSLDNPGEDQKWKDAIVADKLTWPQISNLQGWADPIAKTYNINGIPATFLVDANGIIIAKDLRGEELRAKVAELLK
ncbi:MAG: redoxin domain-containing protein [Flavobacterium sp.]